MISKMTEIIYCTLLFLSVLSICTARPPQSFSDPSSQGVGGGGSSDLDSAAFAARNLIDNNDDLAALKMQLLAQQLAEFNTIPQFPGYATDHFIMNKRQQRYRQCYFNPISCFRK